MEQAIQSLLNQYPEWRLVDDQLIGEWKLGDFTAVRTVVEQLCNVMEELNHHPTITFDYNTLQVVTTTHDAGNTVTQKDVSLAQAISTILDK